MRKWMATVLVALLVLSCGCAPAEEQKDNDDTMKIGFISETMTVERWQRDRDIFVAKAKELGAEVLVKNAYEDTQLQTEIAIEMMEQGVDVLVIVPYEKNSLSDVVEKAREKGVKVISYDRLILNANVDLYVSFDNVQVGRLMGDAITKAVPKGRYLILNGSETDNNSSMLKEGYMSRIMPKVERGDVAIVDETWINAWRDEVSYAFTTDIIGQGHGFDAIVAANDRVAEGAIKALSENRLAGEIFVTGQDAELAACQRIVEGTQNMTVYKPIHVLAEGAAEIAVKMASGQDIGEFKTMSDGTYDIKYLYYEPIAVTKDNMYETVIQDGFYTVEQVYVNVPEDQWPKD